MYIRLGVWHPELYRGKGSIVEHRNIDVSGEECINRVQWGTVDPSQS